MPETKNNGRVAISFGSKKCAALIKIWPELIPVNFITCQDSESGLSPLLSPPSTRLCIPVGIISLAWKNKISPSWQPISNFNKQFIVYTCH